MRIHKDSKSAGRARRGGAEILPRLIRVETILDMVLPTLATKFDLQKLRAELQESRSEAESGLQKLRAEFKSDQHEFRAEVKSDLHEFRAEVKSDLHELRVEWISVRTDMAGLEARLIRWMVGMSLGVGALLVSLMSFQMSRMEARLLQHTTVVPPIAATGGANSVAGGLLPQRTP